MPKKPIEPWPDSLRYLEPVVQKLDKLKPDELNEDVDFTDLEMALRERIRGLKPSEIRSALDRDRATLNNWLLKDAPANHCAYWILGALPLPT